MLETVEVSLFDLLNVLISKGKINIKNITYSTLLNMGEDFVFELNTRSFLTNGKDCCL